MISEITAEITYFNVHAMSSELIYYMNIYKKINDIKTLSDK